MLAVTLVQLVFSIAAVYFGAKVAMGFGRDVRDALFPPGHRLLRPGDEQVRGAVPHQPGSPTTSSRSSSSSS